MRALLAQTQMELRLLLRQGESVLITMVVPLALLVFFGALGVKPPGYARPIDFLLPGMLALAVMSAGLVSLSIRTAYERAYGVLKRLGSTPLGRPRLLAAKVLSVIVVEVVEIALLLLVAAWLYHWRPAGSALWAIVVLLIGTATFSSIGLLLAGTLRAETTLALANGLYLLLLLVGGVVWPVERLPRPLELVGLVLPSNALASALRASLGASGPSPIFGLVSLLLWCGIALVCAVRTFRWE
ncbi:ABC transporter permease [Thermorudis peleae]|uniref:ABC transporter permease n=1 Tax=Thermorudis peleae TaxID=1382356 RepID=UPI00056F7E71|nr:ABC transporter permease [Thermorudis peleae]MBX6754302.1 ABC transporter permease [Thermorudis peleae]